MMVQSIPSCELWDSFLSFFYFSFSLLRVLHSLFPVQLWSISFFFSLSILFHLQSNSLDSCSDEQEKKKIASERESNFHEVHCILYSVLWTVLFCPLYVCMYVYVPPAMSLINWIFDCIHLSFSYFFFIWLFHSRFFYSSFFSLSYFCTFKSALKSFSLWTSPFLLCIKLHWHLLWMILDEKKVLNFVLFTFRIKVTLLENQVTCTFVLLVSCVS